MQALKRLISKLLRETADKIDSGNCEMTDSEAMDIMSILSHQVMSKEDACIYLNMSRSRFDDLIREGRLPKGKKRRGFKELVFYKDELDTYIR
jgi:predicted DNA-binding transcriptional regulator AlpA